MASYDKVEELMGAATDALGIADYWTAETKALAAQGILSVLPVDARKEGHASGGFRYSEAMIDQFIQNVRNLGGRQATTNLGMQIAPTRFTSGRCGASTVEDCQ